MFHLARVFVHTVLQLLLMPCARPCLPSHVREGRLGAIAYDCAQILESRRQKNHISRAASFVYLGLGCCSGAAVVQECSLYSAAAAAAAVAVASDAAAYSQGATEFRSPFGKLALSPAGLEYCHCPCTRAARPLMEAPRAVLLRDRNDTMNTIV